MRPRSLHSCTARLPEIGGYGETPLFGNDTATAMRAVAVRTVWQVAQAVHIPIIGMGGIHCWQDAVEFFLAGASAVAVGTANFTEPGVTMQICDGLNDYLEKHNIAHIADLIGKVETE